MNMAFRKMKLKPYFPEWDHAYLCCYCNFAVRLIDPDGMCGTYRNVVHKQCMATRYAIVEK